jgi:hypothetical protein
VTDIQFLTAALAVYAIFIAGSTWYQCKLIKELRSLRKELKPRNELTQSFSVMRLPDETDEELLLRCENAFNAVQKADNDYVDRSLQHQL